MKRTIDTLISDALVVTMDPARRVVEGGAIAVDGGSILEIGSSGELGSKYDAALTIDVPRSLAMPGLVNTHAHLATVLFRGLAEDLALEPWLRKVWRCEKATVDRRTVGLASRLAMLESLMGGVTCAADMYWFPEATAEVALELGFRLACGPVFIGSDDVPDGLSFPQRERGALEFAERFSGSSLIEPMLMPHSPATDSPEMMAKVKRLADRLGLMLNMHAAETGAERDDVRLRTGKTPIRLLGDLGLLDGRTLLAHCVHVDDEEIALLAGGAAVAHNPMSNLKLASGIAPVARMAAAGVRLGLGTDGAQSGNDLDLWLAMRLAATLQKCANGDPSLLKAEDVVAMATIGGARALGLGDKIGSLEPGKRADIIVLSLEAPHLVPMYDPYAHLVYAAGREDVDTVLIDGRVVMRNRMPTTVNPRESADALRDLSERVRRTLISD